MNTNNSKATMIPNRKTAHKGKDVEEDNRTRV